MEDLTSSSNSVVALSSVKTDKRPAIIQQIRTIFFEGTATHFENKQHKEDFFKRWTQYYLEHALEDTWVVQDNQHHVLGYLMGCRDSEAAAHAMAEDIRSFLLFEDLFSDYECHFHINFRSQCRGHGYGSWLIRKYLSFLKQKGARGVHIVTSTESRNVRFYERLGFNDKVTRPWGKHSLLFMGQRL